MADLLLRTKLVLENCKNCMLATDDAWPEIKSYLGQHLVVVMCAEMQEELYRIVSERGDAIQDKELARFASGAARHALRSVEKSSVAGFVALFGEDRKNAFDALLSDREVQTYNNAVKSRHEVAHKRGTTVSFEDVDKAVVAACKILNAARSVLGLQSLMETPAAPG